MTVKARTFYCRTAIAGVLLLLLYLIAYGMYRSNGDYGATQSGVWRYGKGKGIAVTDIYVWSPRGAQWEPRFVSVDGEVSPRANLIGLMFGPMISLDRKWNYPNKAIVHSDNHWEDYGLTKADVEEARQRAEERAQRRRRMERANTYRIPGFDEADALAILAFYDGPLYREDAFFTKDVTTVLDLETAYVELVKLENSIMSSGESVESRRAYLEVLRRLAISREVVVFGSQSKTAVSGNVEHFRKLLVDLSRKYGFTLTARTWLSEDKDYVEQGRTLFGTICFREM